MEGCISVHDCEIQSYEVSIENATIILHTNYDVTIIFHNVLTHHFEDVCYQNVIFDIEETNPEDFFKEYRSLLKSKKNYCWPIPYEHESELKSYLRNNSYIVYNIYPSIGLTGFVIAKSIEIKSLG